MSSDLDNPVIRRIALLMVLIGAVARIRQFAFNRSLWFDEAMLAVSVVRRGFLGLFPPLYYSQAAPVGFLWVQKLLITCLGNTDLVLRLFPLGAGVGSLLLMYSLLSTHPLAESLVSQPCRFLPSRDR